MIPIADMASPDMVERSKACEHLFQASREAVLVVDSRGQITQFNPAAASLFRVSEIQAVGDKLENFVIENQRESVKLLIQKFFNPKTDKPLDRTALEVTAVRGQGGNIRCEVILSKFMVNEKTPSVLALFRDVTERKAAAQRLYEAQKLEVLDTLAADVAHDINNLLVGVQGHVELLRMSKSDNQRLESISEIERLVKRGSDLMKELRAIGRAGGIKMPTPLSPLDLNASLQKLRQVLSRTLNRSYEIKMDVAPEPLTVRANANELEQALLNVCFNARDAMPKGGTLHIKSDTFQTDDAILRTHPGMPAGLLARVSIRDTGVGMGPEVLRKIFEPFYTTRGAHGGTGLGLTMTYKTVKDHGGYINVDSAPGQGTTVQIFLPGVTGVAAPAPPQEEKIVPGQATILQIDDEVVILETTSLLLRELGYTVCVAPSGDEGIRIFSERKDKIDLVIIDMKMPGKNGLETFKELKQIRPDLKAILTTGYSLRGDTDAMFKLGLRGYILKPYTLAELTTKIDRVLKETAPVGAGQP